MPWIVVDVYVGLSRADAVLERPEPSEYGFPTCGPLESVPSTSAGQVRRVTRPVVNAALYRVSAAVRSARDDALHDLSVLRGSSTGIWRNFLWVGQIGVVIDGIRQGGLAVNEFLRIAALWRAKTSIFVRKNLGKAAFRRISNSLIWISLLLGLFLLLLHAGPVNKSNP